jgi:D-3-phosphoglycerate dehydrogenase
MKRVLLPQPIRPKGMELLAREAEVVIAPDRTEKSTAALIEGFDAVITRTTVIDEEIIGRSERLKVIGRHGAGLDIVGMKSATDHGVCVVNTPGANAQSVAEFAVMMMMSMARQLIPADHSQRVEGRFDQRDRFMGMDLHGKTVGIVGLGQVGRRIAKICRDGFDMEVLGFDPFVTREELAAIGVKRMETVDELLGISDFVSLNCPLTPEVERLINRERIGLMKPTAFLINCARGPVIDEPSLIWALETGRIAGAAVDVFHEEPPRPDNPLFKLPGLIATPHIAAFSHDSMDVMSVTVAEDVLRVLRGEMPRHLANPEVWERRRR